LEAILGFGNFRDLNAAVVRMATLAQGGRISVDIVEEEIVRLKANWAALEEQEETHGLLSQILSVKHSTTSISSTVFSLLMCFKSAAIHVRCPRPAANLSMLRELARKAPMMPIVYGSS